MVAIMIKTIFSNRVDIKQHLYHQNPRFSNSHPSPNDNHSLSIIARKSRWLLKKKKFDDFFNEY